MARRDINGILLLDKPEGISSSQALVRVRGIYKAQKGGHTGALDPLASGLLPICLGQAAKFSSFFLVCDKRYVAVGKLGEITATADREGEVILRRPLGDALTRLPEAIAHFTGPITQVPPIYSAVKVAGKPLYAYARQGREVEIPSRDVTIYALKLLDTTADSFCVEVHCSKGTYIRTLIADIGEYLGCGAYVTSLRRTEVAGLPTTMIGLDDLQQMANQKQSADDFAALDALLLPVDLAVGRLPQLTLPSARASAFTHGVRQPLASVVKHSRDFDMHEPLAIRAPDGRFLGVAQLQDGMLIPKRLMAPID